MRVGIITYHKAENYGSVLQAYALTNAVKKLGHDPLVIDYHSSKQDDLYKKYKRARSIKGVFRNVHSLIFTKQIDRRKNRFSSFLKTYLPLTKGEYGENIPLDEINNQFDCYICGSDQIWNTSCADFTDAYLLSFVDDKNKCISYAASIGKDYINDEDCILFQSMASGFNWISVREDIAKKLLEPLTGQRIDVVPDPVLLLTRDEWDCIIPKDTVGSDYILCYFIGDVDQMRNFAKELHKKTKLPLVLLNINLRDIALPGKRQYDTGPLEFVRLIRDAKYVCTNSFHATLFSLIYHKDFWTFISKSSGTAKSRIEQILTLTHLLNRMVSVDTGLPKNIQESIDFAYADKFINDYSLYGMDKLKKALDSVDEYNQIIGI